MGIIYYLMTPFTWVLKVFYDLFNSYGVALIFFTLVVTLVLFPFSLKGKKSMIQMNMLQGEQEKLKRQYGKDQARLNEEIQKLYDREGINPMGGCLWSMLPLLVLFPLYAIIRQPLKYMMGLSSDAISAVANALNWNTVAVERGWATADAIAKAVEKSSAAVAEGTASVVTGFTNAGYDQLHLASLLNAQNLNEIKLAVGEGAEGMFAINFNFLGIDLASNPNFKFWQWGGISWGAIGLCLIPILCAATAFISMRVTMKTNQMSGSAEANQQNKMMQYTSPLMMLIFGFIMPAGMGVYIIFNSVFRTIQEMISGKMLKKDYEAAAEKRRQAELEAKEEEKRLRREKAEQRAREAEEAKKGKKKKEQAPPDEEDRMTPEQKEASRSGMRQYARGRAYDPARFGQVTAYDEARVEAMVAADAAKEKGRKKSKKEDQ